MNVGLLELMAADAGAVARQAQGQQAGSAVFRTEAESTSGQNTVGGLGSCIIDHSR